MATERAKTTLRKSPAETKPASAGKKALDSEALNAMIAQKAYELYVQRGYQNGNDQRDWIEAEKIVKASVYSGYKR